LSAGCHVKDKDKDRDKTKEQLIDELSEMRRQVAELRELEAGHRQAWEKLQHEKSRLLQICNGFDDILSRLELMETLKRVSSRFVGVVDYDDAINASLADIGSVSGAHRAYLFFFNKDGTMENMYEWCAGGVSPQINNLKNLPIKTFPWWMEKLRRGEAIHITDVSALPAEAGAEKEILQNQDIKSLLVFPLYVKGLMQGFIGFDNVSETGLWSDDHMALLRVFSEIIGNAIERRRADEELRIAYRQLQDIIEFLPDATFVINREKKVIAWNRAIEEMSGVSKKDILGKGDYAYAIPFYGKRRPVLIDLIFDEDRETEAKYEYVKAAGSTLFGEVYIPSLLTGKEAHLWVKASPLYDSEGNLIGAVESIRDITERKKTEEKLKYLSMRDPLTGLYNRNYFKEEMNRIGNCGRDQVSIIVCDVDDLKFINDTLGHDAGDAILVAAAGVIKASFPDGSTVARIGGDEFAVLLPGSDEETVRLACKRIKDNIARYNEANPDFLLSISIGFATRNGLSKSMIALFKEADKSMYREKYQHDGSAIIQTLKKTLEARDILTEGHAERMQDLVTALAEAISLPAGRIDDLRLFAQFHDIGKVGISDRILLKPGPLTPEEHAEMQRHCEIGYRIAMSAPVLVPIADWILKHHEWWNGDGYPLGLRGEEIPLECRILAIADAYDAMTSNRPYRKGRSHRKSKAELIRCAGRQFDPYLVDKFIKAIENDSRLNRSIIW